MTTEQLDSALAEAQHMLPPGLDLRYAKCEALQFLYDFLMGLKGNNFFADIGIRAIHGVISKRRRSLNCGG